MKPKLLKKYFVTTTLIILFTISMLMMILIFVLNSYFAKTKYTSLGKSNDSVADYIETYSEEIIDSEELHNILSSISEVSETEIFITDNTGKIIICSCGKEQEEGEDSCGIYGLSVPSEFLDALSKENNFTMSMLNIYSEPRYVSSRLVNIGENGETIYIFSTSPISAIRTLLSTILKLLAISSLIPIIIMFFAMFTLTYRLIKPLKIMSEATKAMAKGDFSRRIPVTSNDEIGELAISFNQMTNSLVQLENMRRDFVANVSHELKTPMTTIGGFIDGIIDGTIEPDKQEYYLQIVSYEVKRLSRLVQSMLSMAKLESGEYAIKPELFDFRELLCNIVVSQEQRIEGNNLNISGLDSMQSVSINADKDFIYQVIYNLVDNAVKFTQKGGEISFSLKSDSRKLIFEITNTGDGIPQSQLPFVFERFYKTDKSRSANKNSTGLGLYIAKTIVRAHGGKISVSSKQNEYTTFKVILPLE